MTTGGVEVMEKGVDELELENMEGVEELIDAHDLWEEPDSILIVFRR
jgi:hypothetical protein